MTDFDEDWFPDIGDEEYGQGKDYEHPIVHGRKELDPLGKFYQLNATDLVKLEGVYQVSQSAPEWSKTHCRH